MIRSAQVISRSRPNHSDGRQTGFTLIEMLVVIGIMALMIGAFGLALRGGGGNVALQSAQGTMSSLLAGARGQAARAQAPAYIAFAADSSAPDRFLRVAYVAVETSGGWVFSDETALPSGTYLVPGASEPTATIFDASWNDTRRSSFNAPTDCTIFSGAPNGRYVLSLFSYAPAGTLNTSGSDKVVLGNARRASETELIFENSELVRGIVLSTYGTTVMVNNAAGFDN